MIKKCADYFMTNEDLSMIVDIPVCTFQRIRSNLTEFWDIFMVFDRKPKDQMGARKARSKEWTW